MVIPTTTTIELTIPITDSTTPDFLRDAVADFVRKRNRPVEISGMTWDVAWQDLVKVALYKTGADVSGVGTTWIGSFMDMNTLRPFSKSEIASLGGENAYFPAAWQASQIISSPQVWSIPYVLDTRVIFYWRDMLERAQVDESQAFQTVEQIDETCRRLRASGIAEPWAATTGRQSRDILYYASSWVWATGGDFVSTDGKSTIFNSLEARTGLRAYYDLYQYMPHTPAPETEDDVTDLFFDRRVAAITSGPWMFNRERYRQLSSDELNRVGTALPPGPAFVGGIHLVVWAHVNPRIESAAVELIQYLSALPIQVEYAQRIGLLPARLDALQQPPFTTDPRLQVLVSAMKSGRTHARIPMWGMVEDKITAALADIWTTVKQNPQQDVSAALSAQLDPLAERLNVLLARK